MSTLGEYLRGAPGSFTSPNHPVPIAGDEIIRLLRDDPPLLSGMPAGETDVLDMPIDVEIQPSGERWIFPTDRADYDSGPYLIHHPEVEPAAT
ncbi:MAG TPA: hypothetical protein VKX16_12180 [Chloroflexota bacterium]|nr:hypothetical protein [Chloroflexota bacterium]